MKRIKIVAIALFTFVTMVNVNAQDSNNPWAVSVGINAVDTYDVGGEGTEFLNDLLFPGDWNTIPTVSRITAERYLSDGFTLQLAGSLNRVTQINLADDADLVHSSVDLNLKYGLDGLVKGIFGNSTQYFSPFVYVGGGYTSLDSEGDGMINYGYGFNVWFSETVGLVYQGGVKQASSDVIPTHFQHALGLVVKFGGTDTDGDGIYDKYDACPEVR